MQNQYLPSDVVKSTFRRLRSKADNKVRKEGVCGRMLAPFGVLATELADFSRHSDSDPNLGSGGGEEGGTFWVLGWRIRRRRVRAYNALALFNSSSVLCVIVRYRCVVCKNVTRILCPKRK